MYRSTETQRPNVESPREPAPEEEEEEEEEDEAAEEEEEVVEEGDWRFLALVLPLALIV